MQVAVKFVPTNIEINDCQCLVKLVDGGIRESITRGGRISRSGLTIYPQWTEEGSIIAYRNDAIPKDITSDVLVIFDNRGTNPSGLRAVSIDTWNKNVDKWEMWRNGFGEKPTPDSEDDWVFHQARHHTRWYRNGKKITEGEANALSRFPSTELIVYQKDANGDTLEVIKCVPERILAYRWIFSDNDKMVWSCYYLGTQTPFEEDGWEYTFCIDYDTLMVSVKRKNIHTQEVFQSEAEPVFFIENWHHLKDGPWVPEPVPVLCEELEDGSFVEISET